MSLAGQPIAPRNVEAGTGFYQERFVRSEVRPAMGHVRVTKTDGTVVEHAYDADGSRSVPWGERPMSNPRYPLGLLIGKRYKRMVDIYVSDELHECKGAKTAIGRAFGALVTAARRTIGYGSNSCSAFNRWRRQASKMGNAASSSCTPCQ